MSRISIHLHIAALTFLLPSAAHAQRTIAADDFVDSVGVNIHLHYDHTIYKEQFPLIKTRLIELGVRHVRDGLIDTAWQGYYDRHNALGQAGIKGTFIVAPGQSVEMLASYPSRVSSAFEAYEAPNEHNQSGDARWAQTLGESLRSLRSLKQLEAVSGYPVYGPSLTQESAFHELGDQSAHYDVANIHNYFAGRNPGTHGWGADGYGSIEWNLRLARRYGGGKPIISTETGYQDDVSQHGHVPPTVAGRYMPRLLLEHYRAGIARTFLYELADFANSGHYGLLHADGTPKPAFTAVKSLLNLLSDPGPRVTPQDLAYAVQGASADVRHMLFQKRNGAYFLALWLEVPSYNPETRQLIGVPSQSVTLTLPRSMRLYGTYRWQIDGSFAATPSMATIATLPISITDALTILELRPESASGVADGRPGTPGAPAATVNGRSVLLQWHPPADGGPATGYQVEAAPYPSFAGAAAVSAASPELWVPEAPPGVYYLRVRARNAFGESDASAPTEVAVAVPGVPQLFPTQVQVSPITLSWIAGPGVPPRQYVLSAGSSPGASDVAVVPMGLASTLVTEVPAGRPFYVRVAAVGDAGSTRSNEIAFTVSPVTLSAPSLAQAVLSGSTVQLSWTGGAGATSYLVVARTTPNGPVVAWLPAAGFSVTVSNVPPGTYHVTVAGSREGQFGPESNQVAVTVS